MPALLAAAIGTTLQIVAICVSALLFFFVLELVRRRRLGEPYAILWLAASGVLLVLSVWDELLQKLSDLIGVDTPSNFLFAVGFGFVVVLLLSFSSVISRLSRENKLLAQEVARLNQERGDHAGSTQAPAPERSESPISQ